MPKASKKSESLTPPAQAISTPEEDAIFQREQAGEELFGKELQPYSPSRQIAAQSMGLKYPFTGELDAGGSYPGILVDSIIVCWLRTLPDVAPDGEWTPRKATRNPAQAFDAAEEWGIAKGITHVLHPAREVFVRTINAIGAAEFALDTDDTGAPKVDVEEGNGPLV